MEGESDVVPPSDDPHERARMKRGEMIVQAPVPEVMVRADQPDEEELERTVVKSHPRVFKPTAAEVE